jgi:hypothetical protein
MIERLAVPTPGSRLPILASPFQVTTTGCFLGFSPYWFHDVVECTGFGKPSSQGDELPMRRPNQLTDPDGPPPPEAICHGGNAAPPDLPPTELDDATAAYVCAVQPAFDLLRQAAGQLAGLLVLNVAGARNAGAHPMLDLACAAEAEARDVILAVSASLPPHATHYHRHILSASRSLTAALASAKRNLHRSDDRAVDTILVPLRRAYRELQRAAFALPGFEIVALSQGCCIAHASSP